MGTVPAAPRVLLSINGKIMSVALKDSNMGDFRKDLVAELAQQHEIQEQWVEDLMFLVDQKYSASDLLFSRSAFARDVLNIVEQAAEQEQIAITQ